MKNYYDVVKKRYETEDLSDVLTNPYQIINPLGLKSCLVEFWLMRQFVIFLSKTLKKKPKDLRLLDVGCGKGYILRVLSEICGSTDNIYGTELSDNRIEFNKKMNSNIKILKADLCLDLPFETISFDAIFAFVVFMHLKTKQEIINALNNIYNKLETGGYFYWFDMNDNSHFIDDGDSDGRGFSLSEMLSLANSVGLRFVMKKEVFKTLKIGKHTFSTYASTQKYPLWFTCAMDLFLPSFICKPEYNIIVFRK